MSAGYRVLGAGYWQAAVVGFFSEKRYIKIIANTMFSNVDIHIKALLLCQGSRLE